MIRTVPSSAPRDPNLYYGAPCIPTVKGVMHECSSKEEYLANREAYEASEGNCNTCVHLIRPPRGTPPLSHGHLEGFCAKLYKHLNFHPEDPLQLPCHEQRPKLKKP